ncbi:MAG TPA: tol-pal system protein YbgF [Gammaproteobacteria bacterium]|jgi:tol-pal system protein YbgF|nr:tol-pal system protein YbgF [Gammaproteobacteria bacterium]
MKKLVFFSVVSFLTAFAAPVFAEAAPVFDADAISQQVSSDDLAYRGGQSSSHVEVQDQDLPPPPPPEGGDTFVPVSANGGSATSVQAVPQPSRSHSAVAMAGQRSHAEQQSDGLDGDDVHTRMESLQAEVQTLRGQVEELTHQLEKVEAQQKAAYADVDKRLSDVVNKPKSQAENDIPSAVADVGTSPAEAKAKLRKAKAAQETREQAAKAASADQPDVAEEQQTYQTAYNMIKEKHYQEAVTALQAMLKKYPSGQFASNAHYWLGELYGLMGKNDQALAEFNAVVKKFPSSPRVSDAQLKVGLLLASQDKWSEAKTTFKKVIDHYPGSASARLAAEQLKQLKQAGH